jgi:hypothetical protein
MQDQRTKIIKFGKSEDARNIIIFYCHRYYCRFFMFPYAVLGEQWRQNFFVDKLFELLGLVVRLNCLYQFFDVI